jgi:hypothetical protein
MRRNTFTPDSPPSPVSKPYLYDRFAIPENTEDGPIQEKPRRSPYDICKEYSNAAIQKAIENHIEKRILSPKPYKYDMTYLQGGKNRI